MMTEAQYCEVIQAEQAQRQAQALHSQQVRWLNMDGQLEVRTQSRYRMVLHAASVQMQAQLKMTAEQAVQASKQVRVRCPAAAVAR